MINLVQNQEIEPQILQDQINNLNYQNIVFACLLKQKKFFGFTQLYCYLFNDFIVINKMPHQPKPDKIVIYTQDLRIEWIYDANKLIGMVIIEGKIRNIYYGQNNQLRFLKIHLACYVIQQKVQDEYKPKNILGKGSFAIVLEMKNLFDNKHYAGKCIDKQIINKDEIALKALYNEIEIMRVISQLKNPNLMELKEVYEGQNSIYLITELAYGSTLTQFIEKNKGKLQHHQIKLIIKQILEGLQALHSQGIMHRDLKPDNLIFFKKNDINSLKLVDFGLAVYAKQYPYLYPKCGTPGYIAPEILQLSSAYNKNYSTQCDIFSAGCIFYFLNTNQHLFQSNDHEIKIKLNKECNIDWDKIKMYPTAKDLLQNMLEVDPKERFNVKKCLDHNYFNEKEDIQKLFDFNLYTYQDLDIDMEKQKNIQSLLDRKQVDFPNPFIQQSQKKQNSLKERSFIQIIKSSQNEQLGNYSKIFSFESYHINKHSPQLEQKIQDEYKEQEFKEQEF